MLDQDMIDVLNGKKPLMVFDVESMGLHGDAFWVAACTSVGGTVISTFEASIDRHVLPIGSVADLEWVTQNVPVSVVTHDDPVDFRQAFWDYYIQQRDAGAMIAADVPWPVEGRFLNDVVMDRPNQRKWLAPYPLIDIQTAMKLAGVVLPKQENAHHPMADVMHSMMGFRQALQIRKG